MTTSATVVPARGQAPAPRQLRSRQAASDRAFRLVVRGSGTAVLVIEALVGVFLGARALSALQVSGWSFLTTAQWQPDAGHGHFGIAGVMLGTFLIAGVAVAVGVPLSLGVALYLTEYAPARVRRLLVGVVDLMAAVPSIVYGLWGMFFLRYRITGLARWLSTYFGWIPLFHVDGANPHDPLQTASVYTSSTFLAGLVVGLMITPTMSSVMRETFSQAPVGEREGALALGATRWAMVRSVVLPFGKGGIIGGAMLGLGRALGETVAVYLIISVVFAVQPHILESGTSSVSSMIALKNGDASAFGTSALMAAGLVLFAVTLVVNFAASSVIARSRSGAASQ